jgi:hypothetical protein
MTQPKYTGPASKLPGDEESPREQTLREARQQREDDAEKQPSVEEEVQEQARSARHTGIKGNDVLLRLWESGKIKSPPPSAPTDGGDSDLVEQFDMALQEYKVERDDHLPLVFPGYLVGWNDVDSSTVTRGTQVTIFITKRDKIVTAVHQWQRGGTKDKHRYAAGVHEDASQALEWLIQDGGHKLGRASREAWEIACQVWPALRGREVEVIE